MKKMKVGVIGCGNISDAYFNHKETFESMEIVACSDIKMEAAKEKAENHEIEFMTVDELLTHSSIEIILNLTTPQTHAEVNLKALKSNKHVYCEKPFALFRDEAKVVLDFADKNNLRVGCAPDTFLGGCLQTARKLIDDKWIGTPTSATAFMMGGGPESWHPNPLFYYQAGGGPVLDMGPYYLTALVNLLGPVKGVVSMAKKSDKRIATSEVRFGEIIPVEVNTHVAGTLEFFNGVVASLVMSFDTKAVHHRSIEIHGTKASLQISDPNMFGGEVKISQQEKFESIPLSHAYTENFRSIGLADMASAIQSGRDHRANAKLAYHVLDVMLALDESAKSRKFIEISSKVDKPAAMPDDLLKGKLD